MIRAALAGALLSMHLLTTVPAVSAEEQPTRLIGLARDLERQNELALTAGQHDPKAIAAILEDMTRAIESMAPQEWSTKKNARALVPYLFYGGAPSAVRTLLGIGAELGEMKGVVVAMLSFAEARGDAAASLTAIDATMLDPTVAGEVALAQGIAAQNSADRGKSFLRLAQSLSPGTVIDEAASRREILVLLGDQQRAAAIARSTRYFWRFGASAHAESLALHLGKVLTVDLPRGGGGDEQVRSAFDGFPPPIRNPILLELARGGVMSGKLEASYFAGDLLARSDAVAPAYGERGREYLAISKSLGKEAVDASSDLLGIDRALLDDSDLGALDAALAVLALVRAEPASATGVLDSDAEKSAPLARARAVVRQADQVLQEPR